MPNVITELLVKDLEKSFEESEGAVVVSYGGLTVKEDSEIRDSLAAKGVEFRMVRNKLCKRVMTEKGYEFGDDVFTGNDTALFKLICHNVSGFVTIVFTTGCAQGQS